MKVIILFQAWLEAVITEVPLDELAETGGEIGGGFVGEIPEGQADVGVSEGNVAVRWHLNDVLLGLGFQQTF